MGAFFGGGASYKPPPLPAPPAPPPVPTIDAARAARLKADQQEGKRGRASSILTGEEGLRLGAGMLGERRSKHSRVWT